MIAAARAWRGGLLEALRTAGGLVAVLWATVAALAFVDAIPAWAVGEARDVRRAASVDEAERRLRARLVVPGYFPSSLAWPPERVRFTLQPRAAALHVSDREGRPRALLAQTLGPGELPDRLVPAAAPLERGPIQIGRRAGTLARVVADDGEIWNELTWEQDGRKLLLRSRAPIGELVRMARSAREEQ